MGSGDNQAVFALAGLGAHVTSTDIAQNQLDIAERRAKKLNLDIRFLRQDVINLDQLKDESFDMVYTGGHVAVWVSDLFKYYHEASRVLCKGGMLLIEEYHPFRRVWKSSKEKLDVGYEYLDRGPFEFSYNENVLHPSKGAFQSFEYHWSVSDYCNAVIQSGCVIKDVYEYGISSEDWEVAPMHGLPEIMSIVGIKN